MSTQQALQSQYLSAFKMLKEAVAKCPPALWDASQDKDKFWYRAHHVLYWAQVDLRATRKGFVAWQGRRKPLPGMVTSKPEILEFLVHLEQQISDARGFRADELERSIASIRHIQQHTGELFERLGTRANVLLHWTEHVRRQQR